MIKPRELAKHLRDRVLGTGNHMVRLGPVIRYADAKGRAVKDTIQSWLRGKSRVEEGLRYISSHAEYAEDCVMLSILKRVGKDGSGIRYLDIGALYPMLANNTYAFYLQGSSGVLVEPNPLLASELRRVRPRDVLLSVAVAPGPEEGNADFYILNPPELSGLSKDMTDRFLAQGQATLNRVISTPLLTVNHIIEQYFASQAPDVISIDAEGVDYAILRSIDFQRFRPAILCIEHWANTQEIIAYMQTCGYRLHSTVWVNQIFVENGVPF